MRAVSVWKSGYVERWDMGIPKKKSLDIAALDAQEFLYYRIIGLDDACENCMRHNGAVYPVSEAVAGENFPPFHPNCKCEAEGYGADNPNDDPWKSEVLFWLELMYGGQSLAEQARLLWEFYGLDDESVEFIEAILAAMAHITHVGRRIRTFHAVLGQNITPAQLKAFDWESPTREEAGKMRIMLGLAGVTHPESVRMFMATISVETGKGKSMLEEHGDTSANRGAGYIQLTGEKNQQAFLDYMGDPYSGSDMAAYIAENYPLEASAWFWGAFEQYSWQGVDDFIVTRTDEGCDPFVVFLKATYYVNGFADGDNFNNDINAVLDGTTDYEIIDSRLWINETSYALPEGWEKRVEAYELAKTIW